MRYLFLGCAALVFMGCSPQLQGTDEVSSSPTQSETVQTSDKAIFNYQIVKIDQKIKSRHHIIATIFSEDAKDFESRGKVITQAAQELQQSHNADVVTVFLSLSEKLAKISGGTLGRATYAPDGKGISGREDLKWEVKVAEGEGFTEKEILIMESFQYKFMAVDENEYLQNREMIDTQLSEEVAVQFNITPDELEKVFEKEINLIISLKTYDVRN